jgi:hypothetical protein
MSTSANIHIQVKKINTADRGKKLIDNDINNTVSVDVDFQKIGMLEIVFQWLFVYSVSKFRVCSHLELT